MSGYICNDCNDYFDSDDVGCFEDPKKNTELICPQCHHRQYECVWCGGKLNIETKVCLECGTKKIDIPENTRNLLETAQYFCDRENKSTEFSLVYMQDFAKTDEDTVLTFLLEQSI